MTTTTVQQERSSWEHDYSLMTKDHLSWDADRDRLKVAITILQDHLADHVAAVNSHRAAMAKHQADIRVHTAAIESGAGRGSSDLRHAEHAKEHEELKEKHERMGALHQEVMSLVTQIEMIHAKHAGVVK